MSSWRLVPIERRRQLGHNGVHAHRPLANLLEVVCNLRLARICFHRAARSLAGLRPVLSGVEPGCLRPRPKGLVGPPGLARADRGARGRRGLRRAGGAVARCCTAYRGGGSNCFGGTGPGRGADDRLSRGLSAVRGNDCGLTSRVVSQLASATPSCETQNRTGAAMRQVVQ